METKIILDLGYSSKTSSISRLPPPPPSFFTWKKENEIYRVESTRSERDGEIRSWIIKIENSFSRISRNFQRDDFIEIGSMKKEKGEVDKTHPFFEARCRAVRARRLG